jgi:hypothetical protein
MKWFSKKEKNDSEPEKRIAKSHYLGKGREIPTIRARDDDGNLISDRKK